MNVFCLAGCPCSTLQDFVAFAELRTVDERHGQGVSAKELEAVCKRRLWQHLSLMANMQREGQLLLLKFYDRIYK